MDTTGPDDIVYYFAASADGFIASLDGGTAWLDPYFIPELGFHDFIAGIRGTVMGRGTWDKMIRLTDGKSAYGELSVTIATSRPLDAPPVAAAASGDPHAVADAMRARGPGPYWLVGGADLATRFLAAGLIARIDWFTIPVLVGDGIRAFRRHDPVTLDRIDGQTYSNGVLRASWRPRRA